MATSSAIIPTEEKTHCVRLLSLVIDGGTIVLRYRFDQAIPPADLENTLNDRQVRTKLQDLKTRKVITEDQWQLMYPQVGQPDSTKFDITLLACLLRHICGLDEHSQAWYCIPSSMDTRTEADIKKLKEYRNEMSHLKSVSLSKQDFIQKWNDVEQVILRLGSGLPTLQSDIHKLKHSSIDPERERYYQEKLEEWKDIDKIKAKITEIDSNVKDIEIRIEKVEVTSVKRQEKLDSMEKNIQEDIRKLDEEQKRMSDRLKISESKSSEFEKSLSKLHENTGGLIYQTTPELENLRAMTELYLEDASLDDIYVETTSHAKAKTTLTKKYCLILTGLPGEGKTTMATKLISEITNAESVLKLREPSDWKLVNFKQPLDMIFIDDIFGPGSFDEHLFQGWLRFLPDIDKAVKRKRLRVIITTRHYILEEAKERILRLHIFQDENEVILDSAELTMTERTQLLEKHMKNSNKEILRGFIHNCDMAYSQSFTSASCTPLPGYASSYIFGDKRIGFPEIVEIFVNTEELFKQGPTFFKTPIPFFKKCMEELFLDKEKYLALILIWSQPNQVLCPRDLDPSVTSSNIEVIVKKFHFECKIPLVKAVSKSLKHHKGGFLKFESEVGTYSFSHNIVKDMVGVVASKEYPEVVLEFANRDFFMQYVTVDAEKNDGFHVYIEEYQFDQLRKVIYDKLLFTPSQGRYVYYSFKYQLGDHNLYRLLNIDQSNLNVSSLAHDCFLNKSFVTQFYNSEEGRDLLSKPVASLTTDFYTFCGFCVPERNHMIYLPTLALFVRNTKLLGEYLKGKFDPQSDTATHFLETSLLIAVVFGLKAAAELLLDYGAISSENVILLATVNKDIELLTSLLVRRRPDHNTKSYIINDDSALIIAAKRGLVSSVQCLTDHGVDINYRNKDKMSALDQTVIHKQYEVCRLLLENGADSNGCENKYKRTPLHIVAHGSGSDGRIMLNQLAKLLIQHGASLFKKDYRGHLPIHCAAIRGNNDIMETLLKADISQASVRITSYGRFSLIKGMDLFHIAVWKNNLVLIDILLKHNIYSNNQDNYGRTPFYRAVYEGKVEIIKTLFSVAKVRQSEKTGYTPLHAAVRSCNYELVKMICPFADVNARDKFGKTPLHTACEMKNIEIFRLLVQDYNADIRMLTNKRETIFSILRKTRTPRYLFKEFRRIVEQSDYDFAHNWKQLMMSTTVSTK